MRTIFTAVVPLPELSQSISGLWAARICADHFEDVLIIDPEAWLATEEGRTSVYDSKGELIESGPRHERARVQQYKSLHGQILS